MKGRNGTVWINLGLLLVAAALFLAVYNTHEARQAQEQASAVITQLSEDLPKPTDYSGQSADAALPADFPEPEKEMPVKTMNGQDYIGVLTIPALELELPVISQWSYPRLKIAPCRYSGSVYRDDMIIAAHNYSTHFGRLRELRPGDLIMFTDMEENTVTYEVSCLETLMPTDTEEMESGDWDLTLFTCTLGGQSRVTVRCIRTDSPDAISAP